MGPGLALRALGMAERLGGRAAHSGPWLRVVGVKRSHDEAEKAGLEGTGTPRGKGWPEVDCSTPREALTPEGSLQGPGRGPLSITATLSTVSPVDCVPCLPDACAGAGMAHIPSSHGTQHGLEVY